MKESRIVNRLKIKASVDDADSDDDVDECPLALTEVHEASAETTKASSGRVSRNLDSNRRCYSGGFQTAKQATVRHQP